MSSIMLRNFHKVAQRAFGEYLLQNVSELLSWHVMNEFRDYFSSITHDALPRECVYESSRVARNLHSYGSSTQGSGNNFLGNFNMIRGSGRKGALSRLSRSLHR